MRGWLGAYRAAEEGGAGDAVAGDLGGPRPTRC